MIAHTVLHLSAQRMPNLEIRKSYLARVHTHPVTNVTCSNSLSLLGPVEAQSGNSWKQASVEIHITTKKDTHHGQDTIHTKTKLNAT